MKRLIRANSRWREYEQYLFNHIAAVRQAWSNYLRPFVLENFTDVDILAIDQQIDHHDSDKRLPDEFNAYCNWWYPTDEHPRDKIDYNRAWLLHQNRNGHHWQHWVLVEDNRKERYIDMDFASICEMLCDWHSFSAGDPEATAKHWWTTSRDKVHVSYNTARMIDFLIDCLDEPLQV